MNGRRNPTLLAAILTCAAIALPLGAWFVTGSHEAKRLAKQRLEEPRRYARETATRLANRLAARLEALREQESRRPFYHYKNLTYDPKGKYQGPAVIPSPLANGPSDALISAHFEVDDDNNVSLPTLNPEVPEGNLVPDTEQQREILNSLEPEAMQLRSSVRRVVQNTPNQPPLNERSMQRKQQTFNQQRQQVPQMQAESSTAQQAQTSTASQAKESQSLPRQQAPQQQVLRVSDWNMISKANTVYNYLNKKKQGGKGKGKGKGDPSPEFFRSIDMNDSIPEMNVVIKEGQFVWRTVQFEGEPRLVALREVGTPSGDLVQGFKISKESVEDWLANSAFPAKLMPGLPRHEMAAPLPILGDAWHVELNPTASLHAATDRARGIYSSFLWTFWIGAIIAFIAGLCVVALVWQSDRLAQQRSRFAASAAHELRTPLAGLRMYGEMLAGGYGNPARAQDYAERIANEAERLGRVVGNVLNFTRLEKGQLRVNPEIGDLGQAVRDCADRQRPALEAAGAHLQLEIPEDLPHVRFDSDALSQIIQNLLDNAEKYTREAANRTIRVSLTTSQAMRGVLLSVVDAGPGIPLAIKDRLFQPFKRGNAADGPAGLGLGLALSRALARAQGGEITYCNAPSGGAEFSVKFPG